MTAYTEFGPAKPNDNRHADTTLLVNPQGDLTHVNKPGAGWRAVPNLTQSNHSYSLSAFFCRVLGELEVDYKPIVNVVTIAAERHINTLPLTMGTNGTVKSSGLPGSNR